MPTFPKHEAYQDTHEDWLGEIPKHWQLLRTKNIFRLICEPAPENNDEELLSVYSEIGVKPRRELEERGNKASTTDGYWMVKKGDVIVNKLLAWMGAIGVSDYDGVTSPAYDILRAYKPIDSKFYHYLFRNPICISKLKQHSKGIMEMRLRLYFDEFGNIKIPYPPVEEQKQIVEFLDRTTTEIDRAISQKQRLIELLQEQKAILINQAVTKGLNPNVPMQDSGIEWIGEIPKHWQVRRVKNISSLVTSGPRGWAEYYADNGSYFLQSGNLNDSMGIELDKANRVQPPSGAEGRRTRLQNNDVLVCVTGANTGRVALAKMKDEEVYINQHLCLIRPTKEIHSTFLALSLYSTVGHIYFFLSQYGLKEGLGLDDVKNAVIVEPPLVEQNEISRFLLRKIEEFDEAESKTLEQIQYLNELKSVFIASAVTGKIKV